MEGGRRNVSGCDSRRPLPRSGRGPQSHPGGGCVQLHVDLRQHPVVAERQAKQGAGHDRYALGAQAATLDMGAVNADQRGDRDPEQVAEGQGLPADGGQGAVQAIVVVPDEPVAALVDWPVHRLESMTNTPLGPTTKWSTLAGESGMARSCRTW